MMFCGDDSRLGVSISALRRGLYVTKTLDGSWDRACLALPCAAPPGGSSLQDPIQLTTS